MSDGNQDTTSNGDVHSVFQKPGSQKLRIDGRATGWARLPHLGDEATQSPDEMRVPEPTQLDLGTGIMLI